MIHAKLDDLKRYECLSEGFKKAYEIISQGQLDMSLGKHIVNDSLYYSISEYVPNPESGIYEAHNKYIDLQIVLSGNEYCRYANRGELTVKDKYNEDTDLEFLVGEGELFTLKENELAIFFPEDAHMPGISKGESITKCVFKIKI